MLFFPLFQLKDRNTRLLGRSLAILIILDGLRNTKARGQTAEQGLLVIVDNMPDTTGREHTSKRGFTPFLRDVLDVLHGIKEVQRFLRGEDFSTTVCRKHGNIEWRIEDPETLLQTFMEPDVCIGNRFEELLKHILKGNLFPEPVHSRNIWSTTFPNR
ncbi:MAG: hypothetical protein A2X91_09795 [Deltaproteobacteria bacterium GWB2_65_81]|nr:MAG: hypothetical protein A2X90_03920 [Deltaproteobacteria bacterium GWA2_65_63]OGP28118.1 MAG: hypothetical protein A2X91_09795 [Deltaproteobacteria bacterium GWB2_65_81]